MAPGRIASRGGCLFRVLHLFSCLFLGVVDVDVASEAIKARVVAATIHVRLCVAIIIIGVALQSQFHRGRSFHGPRVMRDDSKRDLKAPNGAYHAHVRARKRKVAYWAKG